KSKTQLTTAFHDWGVSRLVDLAHARFRAAVADNAAADDGNGLPFAAGPRLAEFREEAPNLAHSTWRAIGQTVSIYLMIGSCAVTAPKLSAGLGRGARCRGRRTRPRATD